MQLTLLIIDRTSAVKPLTVKDYDESTLYKKCGFKTDSDFKKLAEWCLPSVGTWPTNGLSWCRTVRLYGKTSGRATFENKYEFPSYPGDNDLIYGSCALVAYDQNEQPFNLTLATWSEIYNYLIGGIIDCASTESSESDELKFICPDKITKDGYFKDGFVVDDADDDEDDEGDEDDEEYVEDDEVEKSKSNINDYFKNLKTRKIEEYSDDDGQSELTEEEYTY